MYLFCYSVGELLGTGPNFIPSGDQTKIIFPRENSIYFFGQT